MKKFTKIFIASIFIIVVIVDIILLKYDATISAQIKAWSKFLFLPYGCGVLMAHFFGWPVPKPEKHYLKLVISGIVVLVFSVILVSIKTTIHYSMPSLVFFAGLPVGLYWWNQSYVDKN